MDTKTFEELVALLELRLEIIHSSAFGVFGRLMKGDVLLCSGQIEPENSISIWLDGYRTAQN